MALSNAPTDPLPILEALVRCPSITPEDGGALSALESFLSPLGFRCERLTFSEPGTADVENLFARIGTGRPHICFAGHTDVVPPGNAADWAHPPFAAISANGFLYGRGACDMKGSVAAFAAAAIDAARTYGTGMAGSISLLITGDEEGPAINGTVKVLQWLKDNDQLPDHCLVGEPSSSEALGDVIKIGRRGSISFSVTAEGRQGHSAYPQKALNPIPPLVRFLDSIAAVKLDDGNEHFDPSTLSITSVDVGNPAGNVIPARANARFNIRFNSEHSFESIERLIGTHIDAAKAALGGNFVVQSVRGADVFLTQPGPFVGIVQDAVLRETGLIPKLSTAGGTSDARFIKDYCPVLEFGPTNATIHQTDERISIDELRATARIYRAVIDAYFNFSSA